MLAFGLWFLVIALIFALSLSLWRCGKGFEAVCVLVGAGAMLGYATSKLFGGVEIGWVGTALGFTMAIAGCMVFWHTLEEV